jgi:ABC-type multidrug transport system ATPase subunit
MSGFLVIRDLHRRFGKHPALQGLSLDIPQNAVAALVGANGAGKTTTFSIIGQFIKAHRGSIEIGGKPLAEFRRSGGVIGLLPQDVQFFETRSVARQLLLFARLAGLKGAAARREVERVLALVKLEDRADSNPENLSRGMKVRLGVAQALIGEPPLVLLDEPTAGLDPVMLQNFRENIERIRGKTTIVISSHDLRELQALCDYVCMIEGGKLVKQGPLDRILGEVSKVTVQVGPIGGKLEVIRAALPDFDVHPGEGTLTVGFDPRRFKIAAVNRAVLTVLLAQEVEILGLEAQKSLEESYLETVGGVAG